MNATRKRKLEPAAPQDTAKRVKMTTESAHTESNQQASTSTPAPSAPALSLTGDVASESQKEQERRSARKKITKLVPPRPFPTVPTSVAATGPRSSHREGRNLICLTRRTKLGAYMRRCKDLILKDGYKTLHLSAMGAAIPLLLQLVAALPPILPFAKDEIHLETTTGTTEVHDEVTPEDEDEDITYQTRCKSTLSIVFKIGDGVFEGDRGALHRSSGGKTAGKSASIPKKNLVKANNSRKASKGASSDAIVYEEPEQDYMDML